MTISFHDKSNSLQRTEMRLQMFQVFLAIETKTRQFG